MTFFLFFVATALSQTAQMHNPMELCQTLETEHELSVLEYEKSENLKIAAENLEFVSGIMEIRISSLERSMTKRELRRNQEMLEAKRNTLQKAEEAIANYSQRSHEAKRIGQLYELSSFRPRGKAQTELRAQCANTVFEVIIITKAYDALELALIREFQVADSLDRRRPRRRRTEAPGE